MVGDICMSCDKDTSLKGMMMSSFSKKETSFSGSIFML